MKKLQQIFYPLTEDNLKLFAQLYCGEYEECAQILRDLKKSRKGSMDDASINRVIIQYKDKLNFLDCAEKQFNKWLAIGNPNKVQTLEIQRLVSEVEKTRKIVHEVLSLSKELEKVTIEKLMAKSDLELALDFLQNPR